ncbi:HlyC/CorC family transporter [Nitriliruptoraceae bacterium ZYF776]|nr:HlyC/CorC family transporter [Profundirhabdus halotolerans]
MLALLVTVLVVLVGSGICACAEIAILSVPPPRARQLAEEGGRRAATLRDLREDVTRPISAIVVLNNVFNIVGSTVVGATAASVLGSGAVGVVSGILTFLIILFGEIGPKTLGERFAEPIGLTLALPVRWLTVALTPLVVVLELLMRPITRGDRGPTTDEAQIRMLARIGRSEGVIEDDELEMLHRVFQLNDLRTDDLVTPRTTVTWLDAADPVADVRGSVVASPHSRIVVADGDLDRTVGVAFKHELLTALLDGDGGVVGDHVHEVMEVPGSVRADDLLARFREARQHLAVVVDEFGGTAGVVTLEDVIEVLTGPIVDETDVREDLRRYARERSALRSSRRVGRPS